MADVLHFSLPAAPLNRAFGRLNESLLGSVVKDPREIKDVAFCTLEQVAARAADFTARRIEAALAARRRAQGGAYTCEISNEAGMVLSNPAQVEVFDGPITQDLVVHLPFDGNFDAEGEKRVSGKDLMETGMAVEIPDKPGAVTIKYLKAD